MLHIMAATNGGGQVGDGEQTVQNRTSEVSTSDESAGL